MSEFSTRQGKEGRRSLPGTHCQADGSADITTASDVEVAGEKGSHVCACGDGVCGDVGAELGEREGEGNDEDTEAGGAIGSVAIVGVDEEVAEQIQRIPDWFIVDDGGGGTDDDANERGHREADRDGDELGPERISGLPCKTGKIRVVDDQGCKIGNGRHDALDHSPAQWSSRLGGWLVDDGTDTVSSDDGPDKKCHTCDGDEVGLDSEEMANLVDWEPDRRQTAKPEDEEAGEVSSIGA